MSEAVAYTLSTASLSRLRTLPAVSTSFGLVIACIEATGSTAPISTPPSSVSRTTTLQGRREGNR